MEKISDKICQYCQEKYWEIKTPHWLDTHWICDKEECKEKFKKEWD